MAASVSSLCFLLFLLLISASAHPKEGESEPYQSGSAPPKEGDFEPYQLFDITPDEGLLNYAFYHKSCPELEGIINRHIKKVAGEDETLLASLMRLHFHDCSVRGCDASILLDHKGSERAAVASRTLRGFDVIDNIKAEVEQKCPKKVSCADILAAAARDATVEVGGPYWAVPFGRKDGKVSIAEEADKYVPMGHENVTSLIEFIQSNGLTILEMVVLSGAHTIGRTSCGVLQDRLYNYNHPGGCDPSMDEGFSNYLKRKCRWASEYIALDPTTPKKFDNRYFKNLIERVGVLATDQYLYSDPRTRLFVEALASSQQLFKHAFKAAMTKFSNIKVLTGDDEGEIRINCNRVNY